MGREFQFGDFLLDQANYRLQRGERPLRLEKIPMELLILLAERGGQLVSREEIAERLWGKDVYLDVDHGINTAVRKVRRVLHDDTDKPRFIETVVGKGYRLATPVICNNGESAVAVADAPTVTAEEVSVPPAAVSAPTAAKRFPVWAIALAGVVVLALVTGLILTRVRKPAPAAGAAMRSLAVLPLKNMSGDPGQDYFADGMTEELIGQLANIKGLRVISRTSVMRFKDTRQSAPEIARALGVDGVVEGSVTREGNRVRVHAQLIRGATDEHIWAQEYDRELGSILTLQQEVAQTIADQIDLRLTAPGRRRTSPARIDPKAYEAYLKGRYYENERTEGGLNKSIQYFEEAIAVDPNYALAYSGLADSYALLGLRGTLPSAETLAKSKQAALRAIQLDDTLADPHASLAFILETGEWDWAQAEREYKRALELNPASARTHHWYAGYLTYVGLLDEAVAEEKRARELDPLSLTINNALAGRLLVAGRYDEALGQVRDTLALDPNYAAAHQTLGWLYLNTGKPEQAVRELETAVALSGSRDPQFLLDLGFAYARTGKRAEAVKILRELRAAYDKHTAAAGSVAVVYGALGELDEAFAWLDKAYEERDPELTYIKVPNRRFAPLRNDPRYQAMVKRVGVPQS